MLLGRIYIIYTVGMFHQVVKVPAIQAKSMTHYHDKPGWWFIHLFFTAHRGLMFYYNTYYVRSAASIEEGVI